MGSLFLADPARQATALGDATAGMLLALETLPDPQQHPRRDPGNRFLHKVGFCCS
jgi:hypothetical protein